jgi:Flp pilus assembly protein TadG
VAKLLRRINRIAHDQCGVSAVEFALIVPMLLVLYIGAVEINTAVTVHRRTSAVASTAADLTTQVKSVTNSDLQDIQAAAASILTPYLTTPLTVVLSSVVADENNVGKVDWSCANKGSARAKDSAYSLPAGLTAPDSSVIVAEVTYAFSPLLSLSAIFSPGYFDMKRTFYARPRRSLVVAKTDTGC